jgi:hypothetical protein
LWRFLCNFIKHISHSIECFSVWIHFIGSPYRKIFGQSKRLLPTILGSVEAWEGVDYGIGCKEIMTKVFDHDRKQMTTLGLTLKPSKVSFTKRLV